VNKIFQFLLDKRQIYFFFKHRKNFLFESIDEKNIKDEEISIYLTVDFEYDYGSAGEKKDLQIENFIKNSDKIFGNKKATFFVQGCLVDKYKDQLKKWQNSGHEIGLHGFDHELWGNTQWFINDAYKSEFERKILLEKSLTEFKKAGLNHPVSFRAPNLVMDDISYDLLNKFKFKFDSSASVFSGPVLPYSFADIKIAPVSSDPKPKIKWKSFLPFISYDMFHLKFICESSKEDFWQSIKRVFNYQKENGIKYHLIIFMHSWEFGDPSINNASLKYCSSKNWELLNEKLDFLNSKFKLNYKTINEFSA